MPWIELHQSLPRHRKTIELAAILGISRVQVVGHMASLWLWAIDNAPDGRLAGIKPSVIAFAAEWDGDPAALVGALREAGFIDVGPDGHMALHSWDQYIGRLIDKRRANAERMREARERARAVHVRDTDVARADDETRTCEATVPNQTVPNQTVPNSEAADASPPQGTAERVPRLKAPKGTPTSEYSADFQQFWTDYPRKVGKAAAFAEWKRRIKGEVSATDLVAAARNYAADCRRKETEEQYIAHPSTFLGPRRKYEDYVTGTPAEAPRTEPYRPPVLMAAPVQDLENDDTDRDDFGRPSLLPPGPDESSPVPGNSQVTWGTETPASEPEEEDYYVRCARERAETEERYAASLLAPSAPARETTDDDDADEIMKLLGISKDSPPIHWITETEMRLRRGEAS